MRRLGPPLQDTAALSLSSQAVLYGATPTPGLTDLFIAVQRSSRVAVTYRKYLDSFVGAGIIRTLPGFALPFMHFASVGAPSKYGSWGLLEWAFQDYAAPAGGSPKALALQVSRRDGRKKFYHCCSTCPPRSCAFQRFIADVVANKTRPA